MEEQRETREQAQEQEQVGQMYCPVCGRPMWAGRGPWGMRRMGPWGMKHMGPWGMGYGAPWWGAYGPHPGHWLHQPRAMVWAGVVPALLGFMLGYLVAGARTAAMYGFACEEKRRR